MRKRGFITAIAVVAAMAFAACDAADEELDSGPAEDGAADTGVEDPGVPDLPVADSPGSESGCLPDPDVPPQDVPVDPGPTTDDGNDVASDPGPPDPGPPPDAGEPDGDVAASPCPSDMVLVESVCMDRYEASRPDANATSFGIDGSRATSRAGVLPWYVQSMNKAVLDTFALACANAGKRLCTADEFLDACEGPNGNTYFFGNTWDREKCNCVDTFCDDWCAAQGISPCSTAPNCGYTYGCFRLVPTGTFPECTNEYGLFDINGNVWEIVPYDDARGYQVRGGAYNCAGALQRLQCGFNATWDGLMAGFRCCQDPES
jgi:hypothetical protein